MKARTRDKAGIKSEKINVTQAGEKFIESKQGNTHKQSGVSARVTIPPSDAIPHPLQRSHCESGLSNSAV
jgi:hypothetical protein